MSTVERTFQWLERAGDRVNPILVKETRQALKSRQFVVTFMLVLAAAWIVSAFWLLRSGPALEYEATGRELFYAFYVVLAFATVLIVPFGAFRSLQSERELNTYELLNVTTLTPRQIVWGKLLSALVQLFIFYSAVTPFIAFASLLQGFDAPRAGFILVASMLASLLLSMAALMCSTVSKVRVGQNFMATVVLSGLGLALSMGLSSALWAIGSDAVQIDDPDFWIGTLVVLIAAASYFVLFQQITTAQLTFESDNRSTAIRITGMVQFWMLWGGLAGWILYYGFPWGSHVLRRVLFAAMLFSAVHWTVFGLFMSTEGDHLSRRVRRGLPKWRSIRLVAVPFLPGGARGYLNLILQTAVLWCVVAGASTWLASRRPAGLSASDFLEGLFRFDADIWNDLLRTTTALCCYILIYMGIGCALARWGMMVSSEVRPAHARVLTVLVAMAGIIGPYIPKVIELVDWYRYSLIQVSDPFSTIQQLGRESGPHGTILALLAAGACAAIAVNVRAMFRGTVDILRSQPRRAGGPAALRSEQETRA